MSLVAHWKLDGDAKDSVGGYDGYPQSPVYGSGKIGDCWDNTADNANGTELILHDDFTEYEAYYSFSLWFKSTSTSSGYTSERILSRDASEYPTIMIDQTQSGNQNLKINKAASPGSYAVNEWHHVVMTIDVGSNESQVFVDGNLEATGGVNVSTAARPYVIGGNTEGDGDGLGGQFIGKIDDVRLYDHILSKKEVQKLSQAKVLHYKFDQDNSVVSDVSGQGNDGAPNGPTFTDSSKVGSGAYDCSGTDGIITENNSTLQIAESDISFAFWLKPFDIDNPDRQTIIHKHYKDEYTINMEPNGNLRLYMGDGSGGYSSTDGSNLIKNDNEWVHCAIVKRHDNNEVDFYRNGSLFQTNSFSAPGRVNTRSVTVGGGYAGQLNAILDDVRFYATALSASEVQEVYEQRASIDDEGGFHSHDIADRYNRRGAETPIMSVGNTSLAALEDNTEVYADGSLETTLQAQETYSLSAPNGTIVSTNDKPLYTLETTSGVPLGWAGTEFAFRNDRYGTNTIHLYAIGDDATVDVYQTSVDATTPSQTVTVPGRTHNTVDTSEDNDQWIIESDNPVCAFADPGSSDSRPLYPASTEIYGVPSGNNHVTAIEDNTTITRIRSGGGTSTNTINRGGYWSSGGTGSQYSGESDVLIADKPISAEAQADSDGGEITSYGAKYAFASHFVLPVEAEFVVFVGDVENATVEVYDSTNTLLDTKTVSGGTGDNVPTKLRIVSANESYTLGAGTKLVCSNPQYGIAEINANSDETVFYGASPTGNYYNEELSIDDNGTLNASLSEVGPGAESLVGWWPLDGDTRDYAGSANGTNNGASVTSGLGQSAYDFDGVDDRILTTFSDGQSLSGSFTMSAWIKPRTSGEGGYGRIISGTNGVQWYLTANDGTQFRDGINHTVDSINDYNSWQLLTVTLDSNSNVFKIYKNSNEVYSASESSTLSTNSTELEIGNNGGGRTFDGKIQDVRIYDRALTTEEVETLYNLTDPRENQRAIQSDNGEIYTKNQFDETL